METQIVLVRHGETSWSASGKHTGLTDIPLTENGRKQATAVGSTLAEWTFGASFSSPLTRARETHELSGVTAPLTVLPGAVEWDYGSLEGLTNAEILAETPGFDKWAAGRALPGGESAADVGKRAAGVLRTLEASAQATGGPVVLFAHGHFLAVTVAVWLGLAAEDGQRFVLETATATVLGAKRGTHVLRLLNHRCGVRAIPQSDARLEANAQRH